ncbi:diphosphomevalonate decarboxylase, partial [bacterium]|nr:diphosphomevalonate decarboxylase [bacterium]
MSTFTATAPSNIAFLKYWGKQSKSKQWPAGNSLSMTLSAAFTETEVELSDDGSDYIYFDGSDQHTDDKKVLSQLDRIREELSTNQPLIVRTTNSFPQSCGIASSASGLCALTIATFS